MIRRRPLFYVPGIFSLSALLPVSLYVLLQAGAFLPAPRCLEVLWMDRGGLMTSLAFFPQRKWNTLTFTGREDGDESKLKLAETFCDRIMKNHDRVHGLRLHFTDDARLQTLVSAIDFSNRSNVRYLIYKDDIWIWDQ